MPPVRFLGALVPALCIACRSQPSPVPDAAQREKEARNIVERRAVDPELATAEQKARATLDEFRFAVRNPRPTFRGFALKILVRDGEKAEHLWLSSVQAMGNDFEGVVDNAPVAVASIRMGQRLRVGPQEVEDWSYFDGDERHGGETIRILQRRKREEELRAVEPKCVTREYADTCYQLGEQYLVGEGVERLPEIAFKLFALACEGGSSRGCNSAGWSKLRGRGTSQSLREAGKLFARACPSGEEDPGACDSRGFALVTGLAATERDAVQGRRILARACAGGIHHSCLMLELMRVNGMGGEPSQLQGCKVTVSRLDADCKNGDLQGCVLAGGMLRTGICSVGRDEKRGSELLGVAARQGVEWPPRK